MGNRYQNDIVTRNGIRYAQTSGGRFISTKYRSYDVVVDREERQPYLYVEANDVDIQSIRVWFNQNALQQEDLYWLIHPIGQVSNQFAFFDEIERWIASFPFRDSGPAQQVFTLENVRVFGNGLSFGYGLAKCLAVADKYHLRLTEDRILGVGDADGVHFAIDLVRSDAELMGYGLNARELAAKYLLPIMQRYDGAFRYPLPNLSAYISWFEQHAAQQAPPAANPEKTKTQSVRVQLSKGGKDREFDVPILDRPISFTEIRTAGNIKGNDQDIRLLLSKSPSGGLQAQWTLHADAEMRLNGHPVKSGDVLPFLQGDFYEIREFDREYQMRVLMLPGSMRTADVQKTVSPLKTVPTIQVAKSVPDHSPQIPQTKKAAPPSPAAGSQAVRPAGNRSGVPTPAQATGESGEDPENMYWMTDMAPGSVLLTQTLRDQRKVRLTSVPATEAERIRVLREQMGRADVIGLSPLKLEHLFDMPQGGLLTAAALPDEECLTAASKKAKNLPQQDRLSYIKRAVDLFAGFRKTGWYPTRLTLDAFRLSTSTGQVVWMQPEYLAPEDRLPVETEIGMTIPEVYAGKKRTAEEQTAYAMLVWAYALTVGGFPYDGRQSRAYCEHHGVTEQTAASVIYGTDVVFVFDPANASNRPPQIPWYDQQQERWDRLPEWMKKVFTEAFTEPSENRWIQAVQALGQAADDA